MNPTPEQRAIGKQNFYEAVGTTRREFLVGTVAAAAAGGVGLGSMYFGYGASVAEPLRVGIIGTGDEGSVLIGALNPDYIDIVAIADIRPYNRHRAFHGDAANLAARPGLMSVYKWQTEDEARKHVKVYEDKYEDLINDPNVEAVIIALPLWLHDVAAFKAMRAGKHVLCEKLMAQTIGRCKEMGRLAAESKDTEGNPIVTAVGHQRHYSILYANAVDQIKRGLLGDLHHIRAQWHRQNLPGNDSWTPPLPCAIVSEDEWKTLRREARASGGLTAEQAILDQYKLAEQLFGLEKKFAEAKTAFDKDPKNMTKMDAAELLAKQVVEKKKQFEDFSVNAEKYGYEARTNANGRERSALEELIRWRLFDRTAAGLMAELGSHQLDASGIFVSATRSDGKKVLPLSVSATGGRHIFPVDRECDDHVYCMYEYPGPGYDSDPNKKIVVTYSSINGNGFGGYGEVVMGTKGTLILEREQDVMLFKGSDTASNVKVSENKSGAPTLDTTQSGGGPAVETGKKAIETGPPSRGYTEELEHWAWCIRNPAPEHKPRCHPEVALADAVIALVTNMSMKKGETIRFQPEWFKIDKDETPEGQTPNITQDKYKV
jgi:predicted dehydrogenase